jgi:hypothetical protein
LLTAEFFLMNEPATAITDLLLAIECAVLAMIAGSTRTDSHPLRGSSVLLFWALSVAALLGFIAHGFVPDQRSAPFAALWRTMLFSIAVVAAAAWTCAGFLWPRLRIQRLALQVAGISLIIAGTIIVLNIRHWAEGYEIALVTYLPAMLFLLVSFSAAVARRRGHPRTGVIGVLLSFAAAFAQHSSWQLGPLDHNALYHVIQALGLLLILVALRAAMYPVRP